MSTSITTANGVVVVTQVFPLAESGKASVPLLNVTPQTQSELPTMPLPTTKVSEMTRVFLQVQPQSFGIVQIVLGLVCMVVSLSALLSPILFDQFPLFMGVAFVLSGSLTVAARKGTGLSLTVVNGVKGLLLVLTVMELCVALTVCVFSGKAIHLRGYYSLSRGRNLVVVETGTDPAGASQASLSDSDVALLGSVEDSDTPAPPYSP